MFKGLGSTAGSATSFKFPNAAMMNIAEDYQIMEATH